MVWPGRQTEKYQTYSDLLNSSKSAIKMGNSFVFRTITEWNTLLRSRLGPHGHLETRPIIQILIQVGLLNC